MTAIGLLTLLKSYETNTAAYWTVLHVLYLEGGFKLHSDLNCYSVLTLFIEILIT